MKSLLLIFLCLIGPCLSMWGVDVSYLVASSAYQCLANYSIEFAVIKGVSSNGEPDANATHNLRNARTAGLKTDIYMTPCLSKSASAQVDQMMSSISNKLYDTVWIEVNGNTVAECDWGKDFQANCAYLAELIQRVKSHGKTAGVFSVIGAWLGIMGGTASCPDVSTSVPLWYLHLDGIPSFTGFYPFGGWSQPAMKTYQTGFYLCSTGINRNYRP